MKKVRATGNNMGTEVHPQALFAAGRARNSANLENVTLRLYDSASGQLRDFVPLRQDRVGLYYCGATVQGEPHIGHMRSAIVFDQLTRWLEYRGNRVDVVRNVTDIDDKILVRSQASFSTDFVPQAPYDIPEEQWWALAYRFEKVFERQYATLGVSSPTYEPRATGHIPEMLQLIQRLIERGHAYPAPDDSGDVYFDVRSWPDYGELTHQSIEDMQAAPDADPRGKRDPRDFALWKGHKAGEPASASWDSPWGPGRPGWHIECSAMAAKYLGTAFDIHGGGLDLRFPHHENELAQSRAAGQEFASYWLHNGLVTYQGEKMSKSVGNVVGPAQMLEQASPRAVRYYLGQAHYRSALDYNPESLGEAQAALDRIDGFVANATSFLERAGAEQGAEEAPGEHVPAEEVPVEQVPEAFARAMDEDLNVPQALAALHESVRAGNTALAQGSEAEVRARLGAVRAMLRVLGLLQRERTANPDAGAAKKALASLIQEQLVLRQQARETKNWAEADAIRDRLASAGVSVEDGPAGPTWSFTASS